MRFPSRLLAARIRPALGLWAFCYLALTAFTVGLAAFDNLTQSQWEQFAQGARWYALITGMVLVGKFMPLYIAHGQTRRQFGAQAAITIALFAPFLSALFVVGFLLEKLLCGLAGWPQVLDEAHLFTDPAQVPLVFLEYLVQFLAWIVAGTIIRAGFYRWPIGGLLTIPVGLGLVLLAHGAVGTELLLPIIDSRLDLDLPRSLVMALGIALGIFLLGLVLTWSIIRDVPLRNSKKA